MALLAPKFKQNDLAAIWQKIRIEAEQAAVHDEVLRDFMNQRILRHRTLTDVIISLIAERLAVVSFPAEVLFTLLDRQKLVISEFENLITSDLLAFYDRDPACHRYIEPILYFKGFLALQIYRFAHSLWQEQRRDLAYYLQSRSSSELQTDIHPAAKIGHGIFIDHATGLVVGETAVIDNEVSILHGVTLGGTGKQDGDRHPKIRRGVLIGAGAKILGNIEVGECAKVAAGSVVLQSIPPYTTAAGIPAKIYRDKNNVEPAKFMDQTFGIADGI